MSVISRMILFIVALCVLGGCVQTKTTPGYARAGDHIVIGLGGVERNSGGETNLKSSDLTITLTDASSASFNLEPRMVFKSYPDYVSGMNGYTFDGLVGRAGLTGMVPFDGGWFVVAPLTTPGNYDDPLPLAPGAASVSISSPKLINTGNMIEGDLDAVPIEILSGTSAQDSDYVRQFIGYVAYPNHFVISPDDLQGVSEVGGAYLAITYDDDSFFADGQMPVVVPGEHNPYVQMQYNVQDNGDGSGVIHVVLLNTAGFHAAPGLIPNGASLSQLTVKMMYFSDGTAADAKLNFSLDTGASYYVDGAGDALAGIAPTLVHVEDL